MKDRLVTCLAVALAAGARDGRAEVHLEVVSTKPARPHLVAAGAVTTFVLAARNGGDALETVTAEVLGVAGAGPWDVGLAPADRLFQPMQPPMAQVTLAVPPRESAHLVLRAAAGEGLVDDSEVRVQVGLRAQGVLRASLERVARVRNQPKLYYVAIDGCGRRYLDLDRRGRPYDGTGERLMPKANAFAARAARMRSASAGLPAVTDPNHLAVLTGAWAGTMGICQVGVQYMGQDAEGEPVSDEVTRDALRFGPDGQRVPSMFDVFKDPAAGGAPSTYNAMISGKNWLGRLLRDEAVDLIVHGSEYPAYVPAPPNYRLGDPASDEDAEADHEGTNAGPPLLRHRTSIESRLIGTQPDSVPPDRWTAEAAVRVVQAEDPDVLYVDLANTDTVQHVFGAADRPEEWLDPGSPNRLWDDLNVYNRNANRDPVLDVLHEADLMFGTLLQSLQDRQMLERGVVVLLSDHGLITAMNSTETVIDPGKVLIAGGVSPADVERIVGRGQVIHLSLHDPAKRAQVEAVLEAYEIFDPVSGQTVKPLLVVNRQEMDAGHDVASGPFGGDGLVDNHRGELYSQWNIEAPADDNSKVRWPDLFVFTRDHFRTEITNSLTTPAGTGVPLHGVHGGPSSAEIVLMLAGPGIRPGLYDDDASLVDVGATLFHVFGASAPGSVDGRVLHEILAPAAPR